MFTASLIASGLDGATYLTHCFTDAIGVEHESLIIGRYDEPFAAVLARAERLFPGQLYPASGRAYGLRWGAEPAPDRCYLPRVVTAEELAP